MATTVTTLLTCLFCGWPGKQPLCDICGLRQDYHSVRFHAFYHSRSYINTTKISLRELMDHFATEHGRVV